MKQQRKLHNAEAATYLSPGSLCFVLGDIDYVGGLEFDAVFIVGVDKGRVPPEDNNLSSFIKYAWHNRMYVAVTRAKYAVKMWGNVNKGESIVLQSAIASQIIKVSNS